MDVTNVWRNLFKEERKAPTIFITDNLIIWKISHTVLT